MNLLLDLIEDRRLLAAAAGAIAIVAAAFLPWATTPTPTPLGPQSETGVQAGGKITFIVGLVALGLVFAYTRLRQADLAIGAGLVALACAGVAVAYAADVDAAAQRVIARLYSTPGALLDPNAVRTVPAGARVAGGVWVTVAGAVAVAGAVVALLAGVRRGAETPAPPG